MRTGGFHATRWLAGSGAAVTGTATIGFTDNGRTGLADLIGAIRGSIGATGPCR